MASTARLVSLTILTVLIIFLGITFYNVIAPFLLPLFLAGITAVICQPVYQFFLRRTKGRKRLSSALATISILAVFLIPLALGISMATVELVDFTTEWLEENRLNEVLADLKSEGSMDAINGWLEGAFGADAKIDPEQLQQDLGESGKQMLTALADRSRGIAGAAFGALGRLGSALAGGFMFVIALYYFFFDGAALLSATEGLIPVHVGYQRQLLRQFDKAVRSVVLATFLAAIAQGIATGLLIYVVGAATGTPLLKHFFIISIIATLASLIPVAGTWLIWGPVVIWLGIQENWLWLTIVAVVGAGPIGMMDNVIRAFVLQSDTKLHPLLAFISVLGGLQAMGLWGIFIGPIVASCLHALVQIFNTELKELSKERSSGSPTLVETALSDSVSPKQASEKSKPAASKQNRKSSRKKRKLK